MKVHLIVMQQHYCETVTLISRSRARPARAQDDVAEFGQVPSNKGEETQDCNC